MFARIDEGCCTAYPVDLRAEHPHTSFPWDWAGGVIEGVEYARVRPVDVPQVPHTQNFIEGLPALIDGVWTQTWLVTEATPEQIADRLDEKGRMVRAGRNARLAACDWTQLPDAPVDALVWATYRQALRDVSAQLGFPWVVEWPSTPDEVATLGGS